MLVCNDLWKKGAAMVTEIDEGKGLVKVYWKNIRKRIAAVAPGFAKIVDEIDPGKDFPLYLAYYPYGTFIADTESPFLHLNDGSFLRLTDPALPKDVARDLGYGKLDLPLGMVLDRNLELFIDFAEESISIPKTIYKPGMILSFLNNLKPREKQPESLPNSVYAITSGCRSTFMLPSIECATHYANLQRDYNLRTPVPKSLYKHWQVFQELANNKILNCDWRSCIIYFSESWVNKLTKDPSWAKLKLYLHEQAWDFFQEDLLYPHYDFIFSVIQKKRGLKASPYFADTAQYLFSIATGASIGYQPAHDDSLLPLDFLQKVFIQSYGLKKYIPSIIQPGCFNLENTRLPIYYSLHYPATHVFSPKTRRGASTLYELREIAHIVTEFQAELATNNRLCEGTKIQNIAKNVVFNYFHNEPDLHKIIQPSCKLEKLDKRFSYVASSALTTNEAKFASDARFVRGCISMEKVKSS
ncbi:MAG: hypothetical protein K0R24_1668 [Gammaproteobacteria bacterium]|jgi:hypothetical protein|nr:hypothetical protein [Gammaproteobacteria bacterium]MCE3238687.1 hypothetical protein [Gammaproteobacteria bacterium]